MCMTNHILRKYESSYDNIYVFSVGWLSCQREENLPKYRIHWSQTIDFFSPSQTCFLSIQAHCMYLSFGATLEQIVICYCTVWSVSHGGPAIINQGFLCTQDAALGIRPVLTHFRF